VVFYINIAATQYSLKHKSFNVYIAGCDGLCGDGCHNKEIWDFNKGEKYNLTWKNNVKSKLINFDKIVDKIFIMGGEPLLQSRNELLSLISFLKMFSNEIWLWTRFELNEIDDGIKCLCNYIKTGKYIEQLETDNNIQYGIKLATSNQNVYKLGVDY